MDHAGRDPGQCAAGLSPAVWRVRHAAARPVRRRAGDLHRQSRHVPGGAVVCRVPPAVPEISRARPFLAHRLAADAATHRHRRTDLDLLPARIRPVRRCRPLDGPDQHDRAGGASDRAAGRRHPVHGAVRHRHGRHRAGRPRHRPRRRRRGPARGLSSQPARHRARRHPDARRDRQPLRHRGSFSGREHRRDRRTLRDAAAGRIDLLHRRRHPDRRRRLAARHERHADTAVVCDPQLLADRLRLRLLARLPDAGQAPSASGSGCRSEPRSMPCFCSCASARSQASSRSNDRSRDHACRRCRCAAGRRAIRRRLLH